MRDLLDQQDQLDIQEKELRAFFGPNSEYFLGQWELWLSGRSTTWNPAAFLLGICWLVYRQMWLAAGIGLLLFWVLGLLEVQLQDWITPFMPPFYTVFLRFLALHFLIGLTGNRLYLGIARREAEQVKSRFPAEEVLDEIQRRGGTSRLAVLIFLLLLLSVSFCQIWGVPVGGGGRMFS